MELELYPTAIGAFGATGDSGIGSAFNGAGSKTGFAANGRLFVAGGNEPLG